MNLLKLTAFALAGTTISACGGGGGPTYDSLAAEGNAIIERYQFADDTAVMPTTETATYNGIAAYSSDFSDPVDVLFYAETLSEVQLVADFAAKEIEGTASNFRSVYDGVNITGTLDITDGQIVGNAFAANISGGIVETFEGYTATGTFSGALSGGFVGEDAAALYGEGSAEANWITDVPDFEVYSDTVNAVFIAEQ